MTEQASGAAQIVQAIEAMRKGAASTVRSLAEQSTAIEQVAKETDRLITQFGRLDQSDDRAGQELPGNHGCRQRP